MFSPDFGKYPALKALSYFLSTLFLLLGVQSMYQKFYAAKSPAEAKKATAIWIVGTIVVETIVIGIAVYASVLQRRAPHGLERPVARAERRALHGADAGRACCCSGRRAPSCSRRA